MPYTIGWYPGYEDRVVYKVFSGVLTLEELTAGGQELAQLVQQGIDPVHVLVDVHLVKGFPKSATQIKKAAMPYSNLQLGWILLVGASSVMSMFTGLVAQLAGTKLRSFSSEEEALAFIAQKDPTLIH